MLIEKFYIGYPVVQMNGRSGGSRSHDHQIFRGWIDFLTHGAPLRMQESSVIMS